MGVKKLMNIPTKRLSASQMIMFKEDRKKWFDNYFEDKKFFETAELRFGARIADILEGKDGVECANTMEAAMIEKFTVYEKSEHRIEHLFRGVLPVVIKMDSYGRGKFAEYKTGKEKFWKEKVEGMIQMNFYHAVLHDITKKIHSSVLQWAETKDSFLVDEKAPEGIEFTGLFLSFEYKPTLDKILEFGDEMIKTATSMEINHKHYSEGIFPFDADVDFITEYYHHFMRVVDSKEWLKQNKERMMLEMGNSDLGYLNMSNGYLKLNEKSITGKRKEVIVEEDGDLKLF
jgi:hypothetical protein